VIAKDRTKTSSTHRHLNLTYLLVTIAAGLIVLVGWLTGVPSLPGLFKIFRPERPSSPLSSEEHYAPAPAPSQALSRLDQRQSSTKEDTIDPITFVSFLTGALDKKLTDIQREEFVNSHNGRRVTWEGYVIGVRKGQPQLDSSRAFNLAFRPEAEEWGLLHWNFAMAWFPDAAKPDLLTVHDGQRVVVSGILNTGTDPGYPRLDEARLEKIYP